MGHVASKTCKTHIELAAAFAVLVSVPQVADAAPVRLAVKIVYAHHEGNHIDPKLKKLAHELAALKFSAYELADEATFNLELGSTGRMQLPSGKWMTVTPREIAQDGKLRVDLTIEKIQFKATVAIAKGGTLAVGGPPHAKGVLILAVTRPADT